MMRQRKLKKSSPPPPVVFYDNHMESITFETIQTLMPTFKQLGYKRILFEPELLTETADEIIDLYAKVPWWLKVTFSTAQFKLSEFLQRASDSGFTLTSNDLPKADFIAEIKKFVDHSLSDISSETIQALHHSLDNLQSVHALTDIFRSILKLNFNELLIYQNALIAYLSASDVYANDENALAFFNKRTNNMGALLTQHQHEGVLLICGYRHPCHQLVDIPELQTYHLSKAEAVSGVMKQVDASPQACLHDEKVQIIRDDHALAFLNAYKQKACKTPATLKILNQAEQDLQPISIWDTLSACCPTWG